MTAIAPATRRTESNDKRRSVRRLHPTQINHDGRSVRIGRPKIDRRDSTSFLVARNQRIDRRASHQHLLQQNRRRRCGRRQRTREGSTALRILGFSWSGIGRRAAGMIGLGLERLHPADLAMEISNQERHRDKRRHRQAPPPEEQVSDCRKRLHGPTICHPHRAGNRMELAPVPSMQFLQRVNRDTHFLSPKRPTNGTFTVHWHYIGTGIKAPLLDASGLAGTRTQNQCLKRALLYH